MAIYRVETVDPSGRVADSADLCAYCARATEPAPGHTLRARTLTDGEPVDLTDDDE